MALGQSLHRIRKHSVEPAEAIFAGDTDAATVAEIVDSNQLQERIELMLLANDTAHGGAALMRCQRRTTLPHDKIRSKGCFRRNRSSLKNVTHNDNDPTLNYRCGARRREPRGVAMKQIRTAALGALLSAALLAPAIAQNQPKDQTAKPETHITPAQAKELFRSVDSILAFDSEDTKLPIRHAVKRKLTTRSAVEKYLDSKMKDDKDTRRMERSEIVLKKFGLIDRDFQLEPFLVSLLKEQIAGYYDSKTKTVYLLDWIDPEQQKPVLAHELTHALQDQHTNLEKWESKSEEDIAHNAAEDTEHIRTDEDDTAREAVLEGQAMAVFLDYDLKPSGRSLLTTPGIVSGLTDKMSNDPDSPIMSRAPLLLQESLLFPYRDGLRFEAALLRSQGPTGAFAGALDRPPDSTYEIMNPGVYESQAKVPMLQMPDIHPILDGEYNPYDIGVMGELDVRILSQLFGGDGAAALLTPAWDGGIYYAAQRKSAKTQAERDSTASVSLLYLSQWKSEEAATAFAKMYADELSKKYSRVRLETDTDSSPEEEVYQTSEGPALIAVHGRLVFTSESFDLATARKLELVMMGAQRSGEDAVARMKTPTLPSGPSERLAHFMAGCGVVKAALRH